MRVARYFLKRVMGIQGRLASFGLSVLVLAGIVRPAAPSSPAVRPAPPIRQDGLFLNEAGDNLLI